MKYYLETNRLILRPFNENDVYDIYNNWASDDEVTKYLTWNTHKSIADTSFILNLWLEQYEKPERINFGIVIKETNELIGGIDVVGYIDNIPVIGYVISRKYWNNGYTTEACLKVLELLKTLGFEKVRIDAAVENTASNKVIVKCGGKFIETYEDYSKLKNKLYRINKYEVKL